MIADIYDHLETLRNKKFYVSCDTIMYQSTVVGNKSIIINIDNYKTIDEFKTDFSEALKSIGDLTFNKYVYKYVYN
jgi:hypothetical protein